MNINSTNALLKILEEPPQNSLFFIISHNKDSIIPTIKSRCLNLQFRKFSNDVIESFLKTKISIDEVYRKNLSVMDMTAFTLCKENQIPVVVFDMNNSGNLKKVIIGDNVGTLVTV